MVAILASLIFARSDRVEAAEYFTLPSGYEYIPQPTNTYSHMLVVPSTGSSSTYIATNLNNYYYYSAGPFNSSLNYIQFRFDGSIDYSWTSVIFQGSFDFSRVVLYTYDGNQHIYTGSYDITAYVNSRVNSFICNFKDIPVGTTRLYVRLFYDDSSIVNPPTSASLCRPTPELISDLQVVEQLTQINDTLNTVPSNMDTYNSSSSSVKNELSDVHVQEQQYYNDVKSDVTNSLTLPQGDTSFLFSAGAVVTSIFNMIIEKNGSYFILITICLQMGIISLILGLAPVIARRFSND